MGGKMRLECKNTRLQDFKGIPWQLHRYYSTALPWKMPGEDLYYQEH